MSIIDMENKLIIRKQVELIKGKLNILKIPVMINSQTEVHC